MKSSSYMHMHVHISFILRVFCTQSCYISFHFFAFDALSEACIEDEQYAIISGYLKHTGLTQLYLQNPRSLYYEKAAKITIC